MIMERSLALISKPPKILDVRLILQRHSWERGLNEHTNGLVRQYLPKKTNFLQVTESALKEIENKLKHSPRKVLAYKTPLEVLQGKTMPQKIALRC
jgi:IS30 family transposase